MSRLVPFSSLVLLLFATSIFLFVFVVSNYSDACSPASFRLVKNVLNIEKCPLNSQARLQIQNQEMSNNDLFYVGAPQLRTCEGGEEADIRLLCYQ